MRPISIIPQNSAQDISAMSHGKQAPGRPGIEKKFRRMGERMRRARLSRRMTQQSVADALDVTKQTISHYEQGLGTPTVTNLIQYAMLLGVPLIDLLDDVDKDFSATLAGARVYKRDSPTSAIPRYSFGGLYKMLMQGDVDVRPEGYVTPSAAVSRTAFAVEVTTRAMAPLLEPGYIVVLDPEAQAEPGDVVMAAVGDELLLRRYRTSDGGATLVAVNDDWGQTALGDDDRILAVMVEYTVPRSAAVKK